MDIKITPPPIEKIRGAVKIPPSKSVAHRFIICAALAGIKDEVFYAPLTFCDDTAKTYAAVQTALFPAQNKDAASGVVKIDCGESGSTLRFLIPVFAACGIDCDYIRRGKLPSRPLKTYTDALTSHGVTLAENGDILSVRGKLTGGVFNLRGDVSSQFLTGLLLALPLLGEGAEAVLETPASGAPALASAPYVDITLDVLLRFGVRVDFCEGVYRAFGSYSVPCEAARVIEADMSASAFWIVADGVLRPRGADIQLPPLPQNSTQGDAAIIDIVKQGLQNGFVDVNMENTPDIAPITAVFACALHGVSRLRECGRLRIKECDRFAAIIAELGKFGADIHGEGDDIVINGVNTRGGETGMVYANSWDDHRIAMCAGVAALVFGRTVAVAGAQCVAKSYENFWEELENVGCDVVR